MTSGLLTSLSRGKSIGTESLLRDRRPGACRGTLYIHEIVPLDVRCQQIMFIAWRL